jgi:hypothetical protein
MCNRPWASIYNGAMTVDSRHRGETHTNTVALSTLLKLLHNSRYALEPEAMQRMLEEFNLPILQIQEPNGLLLPGDEPPNESGANGKSRG